MHIPIALIKAFTVDLLEQLGAPADISDTVADSLVQADIRRSFTHGVGILPLYAAMINARVINPAARPVINHLTECFISIDGCSGFGQLTGKKAVNAGIETTRKHGVTVIGIRNGSHLGRLGEYAEQVTANGMVFLAFTNTDGGAKNVAPFGGHERKLSTNPVAFGIPAFTVLPFDIIVDFATSQISGAVIRDHYLKDIPLNDEWTTTESGKPVADAKAFMEGVGALLPLGGRITGHKGYGLSIIAELLGGIAGGLVVGQQDTDWFSNSALFIIIEPGHFLSTKEIEARITAVAEHLRAGDVRLPGEGSHLRKATALEKGIEYPEHILSSLQTLAKKLNITIPDNIIDAFPASSPDINSLKTW